MKISSRGIVSCKKANNNPGFCPVRGQKYGSTYLLVLHVCSRTLHFVGCYIINTFYLFLPVSWSHLSWVSVTYVWAAGTLKYVHAFSHKSHVSYTILHPNPWISTPRRVYMCSDIGLYTFIKHILEEKQELEACGSKVLRIILTRTEINLYLMRIGPCIILIFE